jgi:hypothetical protein
MMPPLVSFQKPGYGGSMPLRRNSSASLLASGEIEGDGISLFFLF